MMLELSTIHIGQPAQRALKSSGIDTLIQLCSYTEKELLAMTKHRTYTMSFASVYPLYIAKAGKKGRSKAEVDEIIRWLTGYAPDELEEMGGDDQEIHEYGAGTLLKIPFQTKMNVKNLHEETLELIIVKAPAPKS